MKLNWERPKPTRQQWVQLLVYALPFMVYLGLACYQLNLPGLHYDEAFEAVPAVQMLYDLPVTAFRNSGLQVGQQVYPVMTQDYIGAINTYLSMPFIMLLGTTPTALRLMPVLIGCLTLALAYLLARELTRQPLVGLIAMTLLAVDPTFIFWNRQGIFVTAITAPISLAAAWCWLRWLDTGQRRWIIGAMFCFGLGIYAKVLFVWIIVALISTSLIIDLKQLRYSIQALGWVGWTGGLLALGVGSLPLLIYNYQTWGTFASIGANATNSYYGVDNLAVAANFQTRLGQFFVFLNGSHLWYLGEIVNNPWPSIVFWGVSIGNVYLAIRNYFESQEPSEPPAPVVRTSHGFRGIGWPLSLYPFMVIGLVILVSIGTVSALWVTHYAILMAWPAVAISAGGWYILESFQGTKTTPNTEAPAIPWLYYIARAACLVIFCVMFVTHITGTILYHRALSISGGLSTHSDAIYDLHDWLAERPHHPVVAMDWGLVAPVVYLSEGTITPVEVFGYGWQPDTELDARLTGFIQQPETLYLWRAPDEVIFDRSTEFKALYRPLGLEETIDAAFYERSGRPLLGVTRLVPAGTAPNPPQ